MLTYDFNVGNKGHIASNGPIDGLGLLVVFGNATPGPGQRVGLLGGALVFGSTAPAAAEVAYPTYVYDPPIPVSGAFNQAALLGNTSIGPGTYRYSSFTQTAGSLNVSGTVNMYVDGDFNQSLLGRIVLAQGAKLNIFHGSGAFNLCGQGLQTIDQVPSNFNVVSATSSPVNVLTVLDVFGTFYTPSAPLSIGGAGGFYGAMVGKNLYLDIVTGFHYDLAARFARPPANNCPSSPAGRSISDMNRLFAIILLSTACAAAEPANLSALPALLEVLDRPGDASIEQLKAQRAALTDLKAIARTPEGGQALAELLRAPNENSAVSGKLLRIELLAAIPLKLARDLNYALMIDFDSQIRCAAINALDFTQLTTALAQLDDLLDSPDVELKKAAILALGRCRRLEAAPKLITLLDDANPGIKGNATWALQRFFGRRFNCTADAQNWFDAENKNAALNPRALLRAHERRSRARTAAARRIHRCLGTLRRKSRNASQSEHRSQRFPRPRRRVRSTQLAHPHRPDAHHTDQRAP